MADNDNNKVGFKTALVISAGVTLGVAIGKAIWGGVEVLIPKIEKKVSEGVEYLNDIRKKKTEHALKVDDEKTE